MRLLCIISLLGISALTYQCKSDSKSADSPENQDEPSGEISDSYNILLFIADDMGVDVSDAYSYSEDPVSTKYLTAMQKDGIVFDDFWATPACTTTRGALISGRHGYSSGITFVPAVMDDATRTVQQALNSSSVKQNYNTAIFGKWHLGGKNADVDHPNQFGVDNYFGNLFNLDDYFNWTATENGEQSATTEYHTSLVASKAVEWISSQSSEKPWFAWVAFSAPHIPFHTPPAELLSAYSNPSTDKEKYFAMIEAMDTAMGRVLDGLSSEQREKTVVIFLGDNGTPIKVMDKDVFDRDKGKNTVYEGGIRTPLIISGEPVTRKNVRDSSLINITDFFATILNIANQDEALAADLVDPQQSYDFSDLIVTGFSPKTRRVYNYSEFEVDDSLSWAVRNATYKYINHESGQEELFNIEDDINEASNLIADSAYLDVVVKLRSYGENLRASD
ncbi:sulfatase-like hydrolase/transferase [Oligoflexaceae bacterium]|nr:sulfatase-like hydrolase/transferase [Oligoflexaceae bacterium]